MGSLLSTYVQLVERSVGGRLPALGRGVVSQDDEACGGARDGPFTGADGSAVGGARVGVARVGDELGEGDGGGGGGDAGVFGGVGAVGGWVNGWVGGWVGG